jgi:flagellar FliJ protein
MAFRFRLQSVLDHRRHLEDLALHGFAAKLGVQKECERHVAWLEQEHKRARQELNQREIKGMPANEFVLANEYTTVLRLQSLREQARLPMLKAETEKARKKLLSATRNRKALQSLRKRHLARYQREELQIEGRILDEAAVGSFVRRERL